MIAPRLLLTFASLAFVVAGSARAEGSLTDA